MLWIDKVAVHSVLTDKHLGMQARVIRIPVHIHELMAKLTMVENDYKTKHGCAPGQPQLASLVGISTEKLQMLLKVCMLLTTLLQPQGLQSFLEWLCMLQILLCIDVRIAAVLYCCCCALCKVPDIKAL